MMGAQIPGRGPYGFARFQDDSDSSDEESVPEELLAASLEELSIMERLGLNSCEEMTEEEVESAFFQFAMAFRCDQYTLTQRLQAEEHDRAVAQENLQMELNHTKDTLQLLKARCLGSEAGEILDKMETCLNTLSNAMEDIVTAAEMLGAAHQEARVSHAVELMSVHVDHLKRRHTLDSAEILETRKLLQKTRGRLLSDTDDGDVRIVRHSAQQHFARRRVSMTLIPSVAQLKDLEAQFSEGLKNSEDTGGHQEGDNRERDGQTDSPEGCFPPRLRRHALLTQVSNQSQDDSSESSAVSSPIPPTLRQRHRSALVEQEGSGSSEENEESREVSEQSTPDTVSAPPRSEQHCQQPTQRSLPLWVSTSRFVIHILTMASILCVVFLWLLLMMLKTQLS